jgi:hypothetical protein
VDFLQASGFSPTNPEDIFETIFAWHGCWNGRRCCHRLAIYHLQVPDLWAEEAFPSSFSTTAATSSKIHSSCHESPADFPARLIQKNSQKLKIKRSPYKDGAHSEKMNSRSNPGYKQGQNEIPHERRLLRTEQVQDLEFLIQRKGHPSIN